MVVVEKPNKKIIRNVYEVIIFLNKGNNKFITDEGRAFIDGLYLGGKYPELVPLSQYETLLNQHKQLVESYNKLKKKKSKWMIN